MEPTSTSPLITSLTEVTAQWVTDVLRRVGALDDGSVVGIAMGVGSTSFCTTARLRDTYAPEAAGPERLFLKFSLPEHPAALVPCFDAVFSAERGRLHILLEDLSETHFSEPPSQLPPTRAQCLDIVDAIADVQAAWWERPPWARSHVNRAPGPRWPSSSS